MKIHYALYDKATDPTGLKYDQSSAFAKDRAEWEAEHIEKNRALEEKNRALEGQISALTAQVSTLQSQISEMQQRLTARTAERVSKELKRENSSSKLTKK